MRKLASIDLNLLVALDALLQARGVTGAGRRIGKSQPAMSHALASLRELLDDELLVREGAGMKRTALGERLAPEVAALIVSIEGTLLGERAFLPRRATTTFRVSTNDFCGAVLLPRLSARLRREAPGVQLEVHAHSGPAPSEGLVRGELALAVGTFLVVEESLQRETLWEESYLCVARPKHPGLRGGMSLARFVAADHLVVSSPSYGAGVVDAALAQRGMARRVALKVPHFLVAPAIVASTDLVATLPARLVRDAARVHALQVFEPPLELSSFAVEVVWHRRAERDPASRWLLRQVREHHSSHE